MFKKKKRHHQDRRHHTFVFTPPLTFSYTNLFLLNQLLVICLRCHHARKGTELWVIGGGSRVEECWIGYAALEGGKRHSAIAYSIGICPRVIAFSKDQQLGSLLRQLIPVVYTLIRVFLLV